MKYCVPKPKSTRFVDGACIVEYVRYFFGVKDSRIYKSRIIYSPTWGSLFRMASRHQKRIGDTHHNFFEGARINRIITRDDGSKFKVIRLLIGS